MPTAARLISAASFLLLAWLVSDLVRAQMPDYTNFGYFNIVNAGLGLLIGWYIVGPRVGNDYITAIGIGLTGVGALIFWALFVQAGNEMLRLSIERRFDGPMEAMTAMVQLAFDFGAALGNAGIIFTLIVGGCVIGCLAEYTARRWP